MDRDELLAKGLAAVAELEKFRRAEASTRLNELNAKIDLDCARANAETEIIADGKAEGKTVADRERALLVALQDNLLFQERQDHWLKTTKARHIAEARSECARLVAEMYRNALVEGVRA
jgi:hypothetical protein